MCDVAPSRTVTLLTQKSWGAMSVRVAPGTAWRPERTEMSVDE